MDTAELLRRLPETGRAFRKGALSEQQAIEVVSAAAMDAASRQELLEIAELESLAELHRRASRVRAAAMDAEQKRPGPTSAAGSPTGPISKGSSTSKPG